MSRNQIKLNCPGLVWRRDKTFPVKWCRGCIEHMKHITGNSGETLQLAWLWSHYQHFHSKYHTPLYSKDYQSIIWTGYQQILGLFNGVEHQSVATTEDGHGYLDDYWMWYRCSSRDLWHKYFRDNFTTINRDTIWPGRCVWTWYRWWKASAGWRATLPT